ncbi:hypothetical protein D3C72_833120 [compost metagenome]
MCDENRGQAQFALDLTDLFAQVLANARIQRRQRFVQQQQAWPGHQRAGEGDALALATGQLMWIACGEVLQLHQFQYFGDAFLAVIGIDLLHAQTKGDVLLHGHVGEQRIALEHHADPAFLRAHRHDIGTIEQDFAAIHRSQAGDAAQQGGFAATGRAEQGDELTFLDFAIDIAEHRGAREAFLKMLDADIAHSLLSLFKILAIQVRTSTKKK